MQTPKPQQRASSSVCGVRSLALSRGREDDLPFNVNKGIIGNTARLLLRKYDECIPSHYDEEGRDLKVLLYGTAHIYVPGIPSKTLK